MTLERPLPLHPAYAQVSALLAAVFILIAGNGLSNTLIPLSATAAAFPPLSIGLNALNHNIQFRLKKTLMLIRVPDTAETTSLKY